MNIANRSNNLIRNSLMFNKLHQFFYISLITKCRIIRNHIRHNFNIRELTSERHS